MTNYQQQVKQLSHAINQMLASPEVKQTLEEKKQTGKDISERDDFIWYVLLTSLSTQGRSKGYEGLIDNLDNYNLVKYETLEPLSETQRYQSIEKALMNSKVRFPRRKALLLAYNYELIQKIGGAKTVKSHLFSLDGYESKRRFLMQFKGIGPKYSRNIMMDIYHPESLWSIAIDSRLEAILKELGIPEKNHAVGEQFFLDVAKECHIDGWTIDRILYNFKDEVLRILKHIE